MALVAAEPMKHSLCTGDRLDHKDDPAEKNMEQKAPSSSFQPIHRVIGRSVTLGHNSRLAVEGHGRSSEFTRVKRLNTLHCLIRTPPRRTVAAVIQPLHTKQGATVSCSAPPAVPVGAFMEPASPDEHTHTPVQDSVLEFEVQEATMELHSSQSSSSSLHSDSTTSPSSPSFCSVCHEDFWPSDTVVLFGELSLHLGCFQCGSCKCSMGAVSQFLIQTSGAPLCLSCCPTCHSCKEKILRNHVAVLNKDFHEQCLVCSHCQRSFPNIFKVYASNGEPCCANCITPVFSEMCSNGSSHPPTPTTLTPPPPSSSAHSLSPSTDSGVSENTSTSAECITIMATPPTGLRENGCTPPGVILPAIPPKLETLTRAISSYTSPSTFHTLIRPSFSDSLISSASFSPTSSACNTLGRGGGGASMRPQSQSLTSLKGILHDEYGALLFINFCLSESAIELVVFWLDVEHFKHFDGRNENLRLFAHHIMLKYIGDFAELPLSLPQHIQQSIVTSMQQDTITKELFDESQSYVYREMERQLLGAFLRSDDGHHYLQALVHRDLCMMSKTPSSEGSGPLSANIISFDKRHLNSKFYVYLIEVTEDSRTYQIFRRYSEWHTLNHELKKQFPGEKFPSLPKKIFFGRSQIRIVAEQRLKELQTYMEGLIAMGPEVAGSSALRHFLTQTELDKEDEAFNNRVKQLQQLGHAHNPAHQ